jgi:hypothetical protein
VTVTQPDAAGYLTVWPTGLPRPTVSNLNFVPGQTVANMVTVGVGTGGKVSVAANTGSTHAIFDVVGFYASATGPHGTTFHSIGPSRLFDTRIGSGGVARKRVAGGSALRFKVTGVNGVPASGVSAIVMNVTVTNTTTFGSFLAVYPDDVARPVASSLNFTSGQTVPNLVTVRVPANGIVDFYNSSGSTDVLADVAGYYGPATNTDAGRFYAVAPTRLLDTRQASPFPAPGAVPAGKSLLLPLLSRGGLPSGGVASAVTNITVTQPTGTGFITATPADIGVPVASNLNFVPGQTVPNLAIVRVSQGTPPPPNPQTPGWIALYNSAGSTHLVLDVFGYFTALAPNVVGASE